MSLEIRPATKADVPQILQFITELAIYEKAEDAVKATEPMIEAALFGPDAHTRCVIAEVDGEAAGFALWFYNFSTWLGKKGMYLEDLYVTPKFRGVGAGKALISRLAQIAAEEDCGRFEWVVLDWNTPAIDFYESIGARAQSEWIIYRMNEAELQAFANNK